MLNQKTKTKMSNILLNSEYLFTKEYADKQNRNCKVMVILRVDHKSKSYSIIPYNSPRHEFGFISSSKHNYELWKAVLHLIEEATDFGESLVNPPATIEDVLPSIDQ